MLTYIVEYSPRLPVEEWEAIEDFVRTSVAAADPRRVDTAKNWMWSVTRLVHYCHFIACIDLEVESVFHADVIERFVQQMDTRSRSTRSTTRSYLFHIASKLLGFQEQSLLRNDIGRWEPVDAYTLEEVHRLLFAQRTQRTEYRVVTYGGILALGLGAGLTSGEMLRLEQSKVHRDGDDIAVEVLGGERRNSRTVPMVRAWNDLLVPSLRSDAPDAFVVLPRRSKDSDSANGISNFLSRSVKFGEVPNTWRLRATWLVAHLNAGTPLPDLMEAAGVDSLTKFERFVPHLQRLAESDRSDHMHSVGGTR